MSSKAVQGSPVRRRHSDRIPVTPRRRNAPPRELSSSSHDRLTCTPSKLSSSSLHASVSSSKEGTAKRLYRAGENKFVTRDIAALDFLLGIPLCEEANLVQTGWLLQQKQHEEDRHQDYSDTDDDRDTELLEPPTFLQGTWWEKHVRSYIDDAAKPTNKSHTQQEEAELERPTAIIPPMAAGVLPAYTPGRRLDGDEAIHIQIPLTTDHTKTKQKSIARFAAIREWERQTAHGLPASQHPPLLDGRLFFSASTSYPMSVFSIVRYEPRREQAEFRRKKLESLGGGGSQFVMPTRDWRGISYRVLLPRRHEKSRHQETTTFNRFVRKTADSEMNDTPTGEHDNDDHTDNLSTSSDSSSEDSNVYVPGIVDDPEMVLGRHRNVMIGDFVTGPVVSSTIQFVKPALLKAELNKQFRDRFDGWEPNKSARKYIGAYVSVPEGKYVLKDPSAEVDTEDYNRGGRTRQSSISSMGSASEGAPKEKPILRIPPSLTLSKIRSLKQQALAVAVKARLEIGTVALACVYFERLCLDCRVDKSNRRLAFAACLLLASKINEPNVELVMKQQPSDDNNKNTRLQALVRPNRRSINMYASLLSFFTEEWSLSVKHLFDAEWGVFVALGFNLHASPSQVAFHFKRLMKTLEWNPRHYLGKEMYEQWQDALSEEERRKRERERRRELKRKRKEERLLDLQLELENEVLRIKKTADKARQHAPAPVTKKAGGMNLLNRLGMRRIQSAERLVESEHVAVRPTKAAVLPNSPSMPSLSAGFVTIDISEKEGSDTNSSIGVMDEDDTDALFV